MLRAYAIFKSCMIFVVTIVVSSEQAAAAHTIRCESKRHQYRYCRVDTFNNVRLERELSDANCVYGRTWGFDYRGVWVDGGCRGVFEVAGAYGRPGSGSPDAVIGSVLGSILGQKPGGHGGYRDENYYPRSVVPSWAIGAYRGYDPIIRSEAELIIQPSGAVSIRARGRRSRGWFEDQEIQMENGERFRVERERGALVLSDRRRRYPDLLFYRLQ